MLINIKSWGNCPEDVWLPSIGIEYIEETDEEAMWEVCDKEIFFLGVIKYGMEYEDVTDLYEEIEY